MVVAVGETEIEPFVDPLPLVPVPVEKLLPVQTVALVEDQVRTTLWPLVIVVADADKDAVGTEDADVVGDTATVAFAVALLFVDAVFAHVME